MQPSTTALSPRALTRHFGKAGACDVTRVPVCWGWASPVRSGGVVSSSTYYRVWDDACQYALMPTQAPSPLVGWPYDLRHTAVSLWLNGGARWALGGRPAEGLRQVHRRAVRDGQLGTYWAKPLREKPVNGGKQEQVSADAALRVVTKKIRPR